MKKSIFSLSLFTLFSALGCGGTEQFSQLNSFAPLAESESDFSCPESWTLNNSKTLCIKNGSAMGPFTVKMTEACRAFRGGQTCDEVTWNQEFAEKLRGTGSCMAGAARSKKGVCIEGAEAYGPFTKRLVRLCKEKNGGSSCDSMRIGAKFAESLVPGSVGGTDGGGGGGGKPPQSGSWNWMAARDHGARSDGYGSGWFRAARGDGSRLHAGVDFLLPPGSTLYSPCDGTFEGGYDGGGYGYYAVVTCKIPSTVASNGNYNAEILYGHMSSISADNGSVSKGEVIGYSGRSGNASAGGINSHVHYEISVFNASTIRLAGVQRSMNDSETRGITTLDVWSFVSEMKQNCMSPNGFESDESLVYGNRVDPFVLMTCLTSNKPALTYSGIQGSFLKWSQFYSATGFNVNVGLSSPLRILGAIRDQFASKSSEPQH